MDTLEREERAGKVGGVPCAPKEESTQTWRRIGEEKGGEEIEAPLTEQLEANASGRAPETPHDCDWDEERRSWAAVFARDVRSQGTAVVVLRAKALARSVLAERGSAAAGR